METEELEVKRVSIGREKAVELFDSGWWKDKAPRQICDVQLFTEELCMPFGDFHEAIEKALGRPVWTHEFGMNYEGIVRQYLGKEAPPTMEQILALLPADKTIVVVHE